MRIPTLIRLPIALTLVVMYVALAVWAAYQFGTLSRKD